MKLFTSYILEAISYFLYFIVLLIWSKADKRWIIKVLVGFYFISFILISKTFLYKFYKSIDRAPNIDLYSLLCVLSGFVLGAYFHKILKGKSQKFIVFLFCAINGFYYLLNNVINEGLAVFDSLAFVTLSFSITVLSFMYIYQLMLNVDETPLSMRFDFWFTISQMVYFISAFAIFLTYGYLTKELFDSGQTRSDPLMYLWGIHNVLLFLSSLLTAGGVIWIFYRRRSPS